MQTRMRFLSTFLRSCGWSEISHSGLKMEIRMLSAPSSTSRTHSRTRRGRLMPSRRRTRLGNWFETTSKTKIASLWLGQLRTKATSRSFRSSKMPSWGRSFSRRCQLSGTKSSGGSRRSSSTAECSQGRCSWSFAKLTLNRSTKDQFPPSNQPGPTFARMKTCVQSKKPSYHTNPRWTQESTTRKSNRWWTTLG